MPIDLVTGTTVITPAVTRAIIATIVGKKHMGKGERPTDDKGYKEVLHLMRSLLRYAAASPVDDIQLLTSGFLPAPPSVAVENVQIPIIFNNQAADFITATLSPENLERVGRNWWQWRKVGSVVRAEWIEMRHNMVERRLKGDPGTKVIFYCHGGAYFLGGAGHGNSIQRYARKLKGRVFAPRYRLAPQFPFPCALQDILAAYLYLTTIQDPSHIVLSGDSAGGGLCLALLMIIRDQGMPMPAGACLISPWVDLTHSFPSITKPTDLDYVPAYGFHAKPNLSWPPPTRDEIRAFGLPEFETEEDFEVDVDGRMVPVDVQIQMYATNLQLQIPLVSPALAASLGGFCPCQIISGSGEVLRDEQMFIAHKMADPERYVPDESILERNGETMDDVRRYPPTNVQLLSFDDGAHVQPIMGHTNIAKHQYRSIAQFMAWALARAQRKDIEVDDTRSEVFVNVNDFEPPIRAAFMTTNEGTVGKAGDLLPPFVNHMIRHRVDRHGSLFPLPPATQLRCTTFPRSEIGFPKAQALKAFVAYREISDVKYASLRRKIFEKRLTTARRGYISLPNHEIPPPSALVGRRVIGMDIETKKETGNFSRRLMATLLGSSGGRRAAKAAEESTTPTKTVNRRSRMINYDAVHDIEKGAAPHAQGLQRAPTHQAMTLRVCG